MIDVFVFAIGMIGAGVAGYGIRAIRHPAKLRDARGRFAKRK